jgi:hypothetical protein
VKRCAETYLKHLPRSVKLVVMLGTGDDYIRGCRETVRRLHGMSFRSINTVAYRTGEVTWVHASHPSGINVSHHKVWMAGDPTTKQGRKRLLATDAARCAGF